MEGFSYGDSQVQQTYPRYSIDFGSSPLPDNVTTVLFRIMAREEQDQESQDDKVEDGDNVN